MRTIWSGIEDRFSAYQLILPGSLLFICQADLCEAQCCRMFSVNLGDDEAARMERASGLKPAAFLECENGHPIALPMAQPYLLARANGRCALLGPGLRCGQYEGRPNACRLYPHFIVFIDPATLRPVHGDLEAMRRSFETTLARREPGPDAPYVPLLLRHVDCPGGTGPPMSPETWRQLFEVTYRLQYAAP